MLQPYLPSVTGAGDVLVGQVHLRPAGAPSHIWLVGGRRSGLAFCDAGSLLPETL